MMVVILPVMAFGLRPPEDLTLRLHLLHRHRGLIIRHRLITPVRILTAIRAEDPKPPTSRRELTNREDFAECMVVRALHQHIEY